MFLKLLLSNFPMTYKDKSKYNHSILQSVACDTDSPTSILDYGHISLILLIILNFFFFFFFSNGPLNLNVAVLVKVKVTLLCLTLCNPMDDTVQPHGWYRILAWVALPFSRGAASQHGESRPWQRSWGKRPDKTQRRDQSSGVPLDFLAHLPLKPESACFTVLCFPPTLLALTGGCPPITFFWKKLI